MDYYDEPDYNFIKKMFSDIKKNLIREWNSIKSESPNALGLTEKIKYRRTKSHKRRIPSKISAEKIKTIECITIESRVPVMKAQTRDKINSLRHSLLKCIE